MCRATLSGWPRVRPERPDLHVDVRREKSRRVVVATMFVALCAASASADPLSCTVSGYKATAGLTAAVADNALVVTWEGEKGAELRMRLAIDSGTPTVREI